VAPPERDQDGGTLRTFHVLPQTDPHATECNGSLVTYRQSICVEIRYYVPPRHDVRAGEWDGRERAHRLAGSDAARISHYFEHDYGWSTNYEVCGAAQVSTRPLQPLGGHRWLSPLEFVVPYYMSRNPTGA